MLIGLILLQAAVVAEMFLMLLFGIFLLIGIPILTGFFMITLGKYLESRIMKIHFYILFA